MFQKSLEMAENGLTTQIVSNKIGQEIFTVDKKMFREKNSYSYFLRQITKYSDRT